MTHELKQIIQGYLNARHLGLECVLATVVDLDGSSYRRPGVRMLINEHGHMTGAVSGGCVEKEILKQSGTVFKKGISKMMTYDGRYRLGCEGVLYILIEKFSPGQDMIKAFEQILENRSTFTIKSQFSREPGENIKLGSFIDFGSQGSFTFVDRKSKTEDTELKVFEQKLKPCFHLMIIGAEHDASQLSLMAASLGWDVTVVVSPSSPQVLTDFPGCQALEKAVPAELKLEGIDSNTAVVLMTHSYVKDLDFLFHLIKSKPCYIGLLGPSNRRERMLNDLIEKFPSIDEEVFDIMFGPAGLNIGAETPQEIALSICSEILSITRGQEPKSLKDKIGRIHLNTKL
ncbi:XdhC family protein [Lutimonas zeaxanthinifaciens]|uniref:XdhC family protein n=1 Tax=Lutimonas zeaxanthinifaciens TaxID=3060215 RepID=UPI00265CF761|nr:XdhC/CoxI family protein [Lutimonas sp. YSD2104]WKK64569.1 XdhC family protein [Lutimonas sp. YSD2104]